MTEVQTKRRHFIFEANIGSLRQRLGRLVGRQSRLHEVDGVIHPLSRFLVSIALILRCAAHRESAVIAGSVSDEGVDDVEVGLVTWTNQAVRKVMRMRAATFA